MKIPQVLAQSDVPIPPRSSAGGLEASPAAALAEGISRVGRVVTGAVEGYAEAQQRDLRAQQKAEAAKREQQVKLDAERAESAAEIRLIDLRSAIDTSMTDPDKAMEEWKKGVAEIRATLTQDFKYPETAAVIEQRWPDIYNRHYKTAIEKRDALYMRERGADLAVTLDDRRRLGGFEDFSAEGEANALRHYSKGFEAIKAARAMLGEQGVIDTGTKFRDDYIGERAERDYRDNPDRFLATATTHPLYRQMDPHKRNALVKAAEELSKTRQREQADGFEKWLTRVESDAERERQGLLTNLSQRAAERQLTPSDVVSARSMGVIQKPAEFEHYMTLATSAPKDTPSDVVLWNHVSGDVWSPRPTYTVDKIRALMTAHTQGRPGLNAADGRLALSELEQKATRAKSEHLQVDQRDYERAKDSYARVKEEGLMGLGIVTQLSELDGPTKALAFTFLRELNARILDDKGNVKPGAREELYKILPPLLDRQSDDAKLKYDDQVKIVGTWLQSPAPDPIDPAWISTWYPTQQRAVESLKATNPNLYQVRKQQLLDVLKRHQEVVGVERRKSALPRPASQYKPGTR